VQDSELQIIRSTEELSALAAEWNDLAARTPGYFLSQTFQWAESAWATIARPMGRELNCLTLRSEGRLVAVWPLSIGREQGVRTLRPLGFELHEYCAPLIEPGDRTLERISLLWRAASRSADLAVLTRVRSDSPLAGILENESRWSIAHGTIAAPYVTRADYADWAAYHATISSQLRAQNRRRRRKLAERGKVVMERESAAGCAALIDWMLEYKKRWLVRSNLTNRWMFLPECRDFLAALCAREDATGGVAMFALKVDGVPIAVYLVSIDRRRVEYYSNAYDDEWSTYSPGSVLIEYLLQWTFERGLDFDFRIGDQAYKYKWAKQSCNIVNWDVAIGKRGLPAVARMRLELLRNEIRQKLALGRFVPRGWRDRLRALLGRRRD
jgi:CelD/BcsL family acetyltransferase involved in cellulose biosynthesis